MRKLTLLAAAWLAAAAMLAAQSFVNTAGPLITPRWGAAAVRLADGTVLVLGGKNGNTTLTSAEIFDPSSSTFRATGSMATPRYNSARNDIVTELLPNGKVLVLGGVPLQGVVSTTELYDPKSGTFGPGPALAKPLGNPVGVALSDGRLWVSGFDASCSGYGCGGLVEIYDPAKNAFTMAGSLLVGRGGPTVLQLPDGSVLVAGGWTDSPATGPTGSVEIYNLATGASAMSQVQNFAYSSAAAVLLANGDALLCGGDSHFGAVNTCQVYDPKTDAIVASPKMATTRLDPVAMPLPDGTVVVAGGNESNGAAVPPDAEIYNPTLETFSPAGNFNTERWEFAAAPLADGSVLFAGGYGVGDASNTLASAEVFTATPAPAPDFSLTADNQQVVVSSGSTAKFQVDAHGANGFQGNIDLSCANIGQLNCTFAPDSITAGQTSALTVSGIDLTAAPTVQFQVVGTSGTLTHSLDLQLDLEPPLAQVSPNSLSFGRQNVGSTSASQNVTLTRSGETTLVISGIQVEGDFSFSSQCAANLPNGAPPCTIAVKFQPTAAGNRVGKLVIRDNAPFSPQSVSLSGTGVAPQAALSPSSLSFPSTTVGQTASAQTVTLSNPGNAELNIANVSASGPFGVQNSCGATLDPGKTCTMTVNYSPTAPGSSTGTLSVSDNASGSPQTVGLTGTAVAPTVSAPPGVTLGLSNGASSTQTVSAGGSASYALSLAGQNGFSGSVSLACSGAPAGATCTPSPATATLGAAAVAVAVAVSTTAGSGSALPLWPAPQPWLWEAAGLALLGLGLNWRRRRQALVGGLIAGALLLAACGGSAPVASTHSDAPSATPAGTYTLTVTATSNGAVVATQPLTLTVH